MNDAPNHFLTTSFSEPTPSPPLLEVRDISFGYLPGTPVIDGWSGSFLSGTMTALTGQSGCGKSTLLYLLGLMLSPSRGELLFDGNRVDHLPDARRASLRAESFGFVFQDAALDETRTVLDNVTETALYRRVSRTEAETRGRELLASFDVDVPPDRKPTQVSGGQAGRIALCRALLYLPKILLADEPTGNLDQATSDIVMTALKNHSRQGAAVIVVTHSPQLAELCDEEIRL